MDEKTQRIRLFWIWFTFVGGTGVWIFLTISGRRATPTLLIAIAFATVYTLSGLIYALRYRASGGTDASKQDRE